MKHKVNRILHLKFTFFWRGKWRILEEFLLILNSILTFSLNVDSLRIFFALHPFSCSFCYIGPMVSGLPTPWSPALAQLRKSPDPGASFLPWFPISRYPVLIMIIRPSHQNLCLNPLAQCPLAGDFWKLSSPLVLADLLDFTIVVSLFYGISHHILNLANSDPWTL